MMLMMRIARIIMNKITRTFALFALVFLPLTSFAHESRIYEINGIVYEIVMGSLGEPIIVDDKTGVDLEIIRNGVPLLGAQEDLQVEMIAGNAKKTVSLSPVWGAEGRYKSNFIVTVPTTLTYRLFGTLENTEIDLSFTCNPAGHPQSEEDTTRQEISNAVVQRHKEGTFGCPQAKESFGFPEPVKSEVAFQNEVAESNTIEVKETSDAAKPIAVAALIASLLALGFSLRTNVKRN
jgi:hypothetical protein